MLQALRFLLLPCLPMHWVQIAAAAVAAAGALAAQQQASAAAGSATKQGRVFTLDMYKRQRRDLGIDTAALQAREDTQYQRQVKDAQAAGLHPLFAMGAGGGYGGGTAPQVRAGQPVTGSYAGSGIGKAAQEIGRGIERHYGDKRRAAADAMATEMHNAQMKAISAQTNLDNVRALEVASAIKLAEQRANYTRPSYADFLAQKASVEPPSRFQDFDPPDPQKGRHKRYDTYLGPIILKPGADADSLTQGIGEFAELITGIEALNNLVDQTTKGVRANPEMLSLSKGARAARQYKRKRQMQRQRAAVGRYRRNFK